MSDPACCGICGEAPRAGDPGLSPRPALGDRVCVWCSYWNVPPGPEREAARAKRASAHIVQSPVLGPVPRGPPATRLTFAEVERCFQLLVRLVPALWPHGWHLATIHFETETERFKAHFRWREDSIAAGAHVRLTDGKFVPVEGGMHAMASAGRAMDVFVRVARIVIEEES